MKRVAVEGVAVNWPQNALRLACVLLTLATVGCRSAPNTRVSPADDINTSPAARAKADGGIPPYTPADVRFMQGMIGHHAQAVVMAGWADSHGANNAVRVLAARIVVGQQDEIDFMQRWLTDRKQTVPAADAAHGHSGHDMSSMGGSGMPALMPGMLTPEQMTALSNARGVEFDRLFLTGMIQHHQGALAMVDELFGARGAGQDDDIFKFASDVSADQSTEIDRMRVILSQLPSTGANP